MKQPDKEQKIQVVESIVLMKCGAFSPVGFSLYAIAYRNGEHTIRNLEEKHGVFVGSFTPSPERYSL
jgi:hypothetical protein